MKFAKEAIQVEAVGPFHTTVVDLRFFCRIVLPSHFQKWCKLKFDKISTFPHFIKQIPPPENSCRGQRFHLNSHTAKFRLRVQNLERP